MENRIEEFRKRKGLSQERLGDKIHVTKATISKLERGEQPLTQEYMERIAKIVGCKPYEIIMPAEDALAINAIISTASGVADAYSSLPDSEKPKARGFLQVVFDAEDGLGFSKNRDLKKIRR